ncbi:NAD(P)/FAD-dependent oxidoreductase [Limnochorda pilosa]|uniref:Pyridine nucleotide-disulfide oxidoreductase n=1 Tax=Limnochorda pilosa TaxID=1555112 RepID=A0A0K2SIL0_LIMPI|nr:FAD-dependent oxidoreductase [Limnochorda pilosa]BAS26948.1 pyridine nucleotide-disulfide oxidoreductase [Limnochorda pilosa]
MATETRSFRHVVVGGGFAGEHAVRGIRKLDPEGSIALFSLEPHPPYQRPPLSKGLWLGGSEEKLPLRKEGYGEVGVELFLGTEVAHLDRAAHTVTDVSGRVFRYEKLLLATGGRVKQLPFGEDRILYYRTLDDYHALRRRTEAGERFVIIGGGFIGAELAAALAQNGKQVRMVFPEAAVLERVLPGDLARWVTGYYREKGVEVLAGDAPVAVEPVGGSSATGRSRVRLKSGTSLEADGVVAGIGIRPDTRLAEEAGLRVDDGIVVDGFLRTEDPDVFAAGDVARFPYAALGRLARVEHEENAIRQGETAGVNMAGGSERYDLSPMFYSDLFDLGFEAVGDLSSRHRTEALWKEPYREGIVHYLEGDRVVGILLWNAWGRLDEAREVLGSIRRLSLDGA